MWTVIYTLFNTTKLCLLLDGVNFIEGDSIISQQDGPFPLFSNEARECLTLIRLAKVDWVT